MASKPKYLWPPILALILALLLCGEATAKIVSLACSGTKQELVKGEPPGAQHEPWMFSASASRRRSFSEDTLSD
jgi:hypothetical protein